MIGSYGLYVPVYSTRLKPIACLEMYATEAVHRAPSLSRHQGTVLITRRVVVITPFQSRCLSTRLGRPIHPRIL